MLCALNNGNYSVWQVLPELQYPYSTRTMATFWTSAPSLRHRLPRKNCSLDPLKFASRVKKTTTTFCSVFQTRRNEYHMYIMIIMMYYDRNRFFSFLLHSFVNIILWKNITPLLVKSDTSGNENSI